MNLREVLRNKKINKKLDHKGSALITVIIIMAFVTILAALAMWTAYMNYYMKVTEMKSNNTFYSAEGVVEQIKVGLQEELSQATSDAYSKVLQRYSEYSEVDRLNYFYSEIIKSLRKNLMATAVNQYNLGNLVSFVDSAYSINPGVDTDTNEYIVKIRDDNGKEHTAKITGGNRLLTIEGTKVTLCDITVEFTDANDYTSIINTDFTLQAPKIDFEDPSNKTSILNYVLVADEHLIGEGADDVTIMGSVYGGAGDRVLPTDPIDVLKKPTAEDASEYTLYGDPRNGIALNNCKRWKFSNAEHLVCGSTIALSRGSTMETEGATELWTKDIVLGELNNNVTSEELTLNGTSYVADDLSIDDSGSKVKIGGSYYGYGNNRDHSEDSSAILINAKKVALDMTAVDSLWLAGRSYVATSRVKVPNIGIETPPANNEEVPMSESIAVRGNQVAYLVPYQAIAVYHGPAGDTRLAKRNPMTKDEYEAILSEYSGVSKNPADGYYISDVDFQTPLPGTNINLNTYASTYRKVFAQGFDGNYLVYYYMDMTPENANKFFADYYGVESNKTNIDKYVKIYTENGGIKTKNPGVEDSGAELEPGESVDAGEFTRIDIAGNWLTWDGNDTDIVKFNKPKNTTNSAGLTSEATNNANSFMALNAKLVKNINKVTADELTKRPFENLVDETKLPSSVTTFTYKTDSGDEYKGIAVDGDYTYSASPSSNIRVIIASGNVTLENDFNGTILCKKTIEVRPGVRTIMSNIDVQTEVVYALNGRVNPDDVAEDKMLVILKDGDQYDLGDAVEEKEAVTNMDDLVNYENWTKR